MQNEKFKDFKIEYDKFIRFEGGESYDRLEDWFYTLQQRHKLIRDKIGGFSNTQLVKVKNNLCAPVSISEISWILNDINYYLPNYKKDNGFINDEIFTSPDLPNKKGKLTRHLLKYAKSKDLGWNLYSLERAISNLSNSWAKSTLNGGKYYLKIDTTAMSFVKLGHYGCDNDSCFGQGGCHWNNKYNLGKALNTFVCLVSNTPFGEKEDIIGRAWGYLSNKGKAINISNLYPTEINMKTLVHIIHKGFEQITKQQLLKYEKLCEISEDIYQNAENYTFSTCKNLNLKFPQSLNAARFLYPKTKVNKRKLALV